MLITKKEISRKDVIGTSLIGYLNLNYDEIKSIFGNPNSNGDKCKVDWEWLLKLNNTTITIYNWKDGPSYLKRKSIKPSDITDWHVGGNYNYDLVILKDYIIQERPSYSDRLLVKDA